MASIDFYYMPESPPCRAVEMVAEIIGLKLNKHYVNLFKGEQCAEEYLKINPLHKVPFLVDGNLKLGESRAIMMYLVNKYKPDNEHLYPKDPVKRAAIDEMLFYEIGTYYPAGHDLLYPIFLGIKKEADPEHVKAYEATLHYLDKKLENGAKKYILGDHLTIADVSLVTSLSMAHATGYDLHEHKHLVAYIERMKSAIPNYSAINDKAAENMKQFIESKKNAS